MSNLLDKASILLTPTAYNDGSILSIKPENGDGDFTFSRSSAATRVNAQGLVENVQIISSELVSNGNFSQIGTEEVSNGNFSQEGSELVTNGDFATDSDWSKVNATISDGKGNLDSTSSTSILFQQNVLTVGKTYKANFDVSNYNGLGTCALINSSGGIQFEITSNGNADFYFTHGGASANLVFRAVASGAFSIDNVSVKEVGQDWNLGTGWSIGEDKAIATGVVNTELEQLNVLTSGKSYKITYTILDYVSGSVRFRANLVSGATNSANGTYTDYIVAAGSKFKLQGLNSFNGSVTNISVKEVGQDWTFGTGWSVDQANSKAIATSSPSGQSVGQNSVASSLSNGSLAQVSFQVLDITQGSFGIYFSGTLVGSMNSVGTFNGTFIKGTETSFYIRALGTTSGSISNISVKEITDDTDLPRINYEGFSYQDSLGSEEVVNGDFATDSNWSKGAGWSIANGVATHTGGASYLSQSILNANTQYKVNISVTSVSGGGFVQIYMGNSPASVLISAIGEYTYYFTSQSSVSLGFALRSLGDVSIDNVSVKEYLGQEVVPDSGCGSWLLEGQSTNLVTESELFSGWVLDDVTVESDSDTSPDGNNKATLIKGNTNSSRHHIRKTLSGSVDASYSIFAKAKELRYLQIASINTTNQYVNFDLQDGLVGTVGSDFSNAKIEEIGSGWYRLSVTSDDRYNSFYISLVSGTNATWLESWVMSNNTDGLYIWGAQLEQQSYATSYIPTSGATNTRLQDIATNSGNSTLINSTEGVLYAEVSNVSKEYYGNISLTDGTNSQRVQIYFNKDALSLMFFIRVDGVLLATHTVSSSGINYEDTNKIAIKYKTNDMSFWLNGTKVGTDTSGTLVPNKFTKLGFNSGSGGTFFGKAKALAVYNTALTDAELQALTT